MAPPNVIIFYTDDLGWGDLACFGSDTVLSPRLEELCNDGIKLSQWYSNAPVCSPSRASLLTGKYPGHAGVRTILGGNRHQSGLPHQATLASELKNRGYTTGLFGKWHLGVAPQYSPVNYGFDEVFGFRAGCVDYYSHIFYWGDKAPVHDLWEGETEVWRNGEYLTTQLGRRATDFVERHKDSPFFCYVPFNAPHYPLHAPAKYVDQFQHLPADKAIMAAMILAVDDAVGEVVDKLKELGLYDNTLIFFSSDNGPSEESRNWLNGEEVSYKGGSAGGLRGSKGSLFEGGIRVPSFVTWPQGLPRGVELNAPGLMMDVLPTVLDAVDAAMEKTPSNPHDIDGITQLPALQGTGQEDDRVVHWNYLDQWAVRRGRYKYVENVREGMDPPAAVASALYNIDTDPREKVDISREHPELLGAIQENLAHAQKLEEGWEAI